MSVVRLQSFRFILVGIFNTLSGLTIIFAAKSIGGLDDFESNLLGYSFGLLISFFLNRKWTFRHNGRIFPTAIRFVIVFLLSYMANLAAVYGLRDGVGANSYLAQAMGVIPYTVVFYLGSRYYVFSEDRIETSQSGSRQAKYS
jgi:putative flippase GtrA